MAMPPVHGRSEVGEAVGRHARNVLNGGSDEMTKRKLDANAEPLVIPFTREEVTELRTLAGESYTNPADFVHSFMQSALRVARGFNPEEECAPATNNG